MAPHAIGIGHPLVIKHLPHLVGLVAIHARREDVGFLFPQLTTDDLAVDRFYLRMTLRAGRGDILPVDRRTGVRVAEDPVRGVARRAVGRDNEPFLHQPFAVDALGVILEDVCLVNRTLPRYR